MERTERYVRRGGDLKALSVSSTRIKWSNEDTKLIRKKFGPLYASAIGKVTKTQIKDHFFKAQGFLILLTSSTPFKNKSKGFFIEELLLSIYFSKKVLSVPRSRLKLIHN